MTSTKRSRHAALLVGMATVTALACNLIFASAAPAYADTTHQTKAIAIEGQIAPGTGGKTFDHCTAQDIVVNAGNVCTDEPMVNDRGDVVFVSTYGGGTGTGIFLWHEGKLSPIAVTGQTTPAGTIGGGTFLSDYDGPAFNNDATVAFVANILTGGPSTTAVFQKRLGHGLTTIARQGDNAPGGGTFTFFDDLAQNNKGDVAFIAGYDNGGPQTGIFLKPAEGSLRAIVRGGSKLTSTGWTLCGFVDGPWLNDNGTVVFQADSVCDALGNSLAAFDGSVFIKQLEKSIQPLVLIGDPGPKSVGGTITEIKIGRPGINRDQVGLILALTGGSTENVLATKPLKGSNDFSVCARQGDPAPAGGGVLSFNGDPAIAADGTLSMPATVGPNDSIDGIFTCRNGRSEPIALQGDVKPVGTGNTYGSLEEASLSEHYIVFQDESNSPTGVYLGTINH